MMTTIRHIVTLWRPSMVLAVLVGFVIGFVIGQITGRTEMPSVSAPLVLSPTNQIAQWATAAAMGDIGAASALMDEYDAAGWRNRWEGVREVYAVQPSHTLRDIEQRGSTTYAVVVYPTASVSPTGSICVPVAATAQGQIIVQGEHTHCQPSVRTTP